MRGVGLTFMFWDHGKCRLIVRSILENNIVTKEKITTYLKESCQYGYDLNSILFFSKGGKDITNIAGIF